MAGFLHICLSLITPVYGSSSLIDCLSRHNPNDSYISSYYLFWTTFFYLPEFFFIVTLFVFYQRVLVVDNVLIKLLISAIGVNAVYLTELLDFLPINYVSEIAVSVENISNPLLLNMLNRYHPLIFYISVALLIYSVLILSLRSFNSISSFLNSFILLNIKHLNLQTLNTNFIALWLGGWWAFQEGTWGGWWNSDISEMLGLLITVSSVTFLHINIFSKNLRSLSFFLYSSFSSFLILYYFIQINYELTSHNFGARFFFFFNNNLLLLELICFLILTTVLLICWRYELIIKNSYLFNESSSILLHFKKLWLATYTILWFNFCVWMTYSLLPLIDIFTQNYIHVTDVNLYNIYTFSQVIFLLFITSTSFALTLRSVVTHLVILNSYPYLEMLLVPFYMNKWGSVRVAHMLISGFVTLNICMSNMTFLYWGSSNDYINFYTTNRVYSFYTTISVCDGDNFNIIFITTNDDNLIVSSWTTVPTFSNSTNVDQFGLIFNYDTLFNYFYFVTDWVKIFIMIESVDTPMLGVLPLASLLLILIKSLQWYGVSTYTKNVY